MLIFAHSSKLKLKLHALEEHVQFSLRNCCFSSTVCRYCFPFGRPEGALKATLSLLERVSTLMCRFMSLCKSLFPTGKQ